LVLVRWAVVADGANPVGLLQKLVAVFFDALPLVVNRGLIGDEFRLFSIFNENTDNCVGNKNGVRNGVEELSVVGDRFWTEMGRITITGNDKT